ncbi:phosphatase 2C-like domain-containing protein [Mycena vulgaris]|nr:phosphatase 2C-like domain-containing protein [Mycena vulgaris]
MQLGSFVSKTHVLSEGTTVSQSTLPTSDEDRTVVLEFEHGTMIAIFNGHNSDELSEFASKHLPRLVAERFDPTVSDVEQVISQIFEDFDQSLLLKVTRLFEPGEDWSGEEWMDDRKVFDIVGYRQQYPRFRRGRRAIVGTTVLIGIIDKEKKRIWVVSLGDSDAGLSTSLPRNPLDRQQAVCRRMQDGKLTPILLSERHNCTDAKEMERLATEHPGEKDIVKYGRVLGLLAVTRALGDHQLKVKSRLLASRIMPCYYPSPVMEVCFEEWVENGNSTPPYLLSTPVVQRHDLLPGDVLIFASDGLRDSMDHIPAAAGDSWDIIMSLANGEEHEGLGHTRIEPVDGDNPAELLIKNVLFGQDTDKRAKELADSQRDNISVVIVDLGWNFCT